MNERVEQKFRELGKKLSDKTPRRKTASHSMRPGETSSHARIAAVAGKISDKIQLGHEQGLHNSARSRDEKSEKITHQSAPVLKFKERLAECRNASKKRNHGISSRAQQ